MKTKSKALLLTLCAVLLVAASVLGTMAYLTDNDTVTNTFTVGNVEFGGKDHKYGLDEAKVDENGKALTGEKAERVQENKYKLLPGHTYDKDPTIHVNAESEDCYIRATVTLTNADKWMAIAKKYVNSNITEIITGFDEEIWYVFGPEVDENANTITYTLWYKNESKDESLKRVWQSGDPTDLVIFKQIVMPDDVTNEELAGVASTTITVNAYGIQADGFDSPEEAWAAFPATTPTPAPTTEPTA